MSTVIPSKKLIANTFSKRASRYGETAFVQRRILQLLIGLIKENLPFDLPLLDAGCGSGPLGTMLQYEKLPLTLFHADLAFNTLAKLRTGRPLAVQSDVEALPYKNAVFGGAVSSSVFQWLDNTEEAATELRRVLVDDGVLYFSVYLENSFSQLVALRRKRGLSIPVRLFSRDEFENLLTAAGFANIKTEIIREQYYFSSGRDVIRFLSDSGSTAVSGKHLGRTELFSLCGEYEDTFSTAHGVPLTVHVALGTARKGR